MTVPLESSIKLARANERLTLDNANLRALNRKILRSGGLSVESVIAEMKAILQKEKPIVFSPQVIAKQKTQHTPPVNSDHFEYATLVWSDWHISEVVKYEDSNNVNAYNSIIAANRVHELVKTNKQIIRLHEAMYPIKKIWIPILGDMINGTIHPELAMTNDLSDSAATILAARLLIMAIKDIKTLGIPIQIDCIVGNHPRMTAKMPTKAQAQVSFDWLVYEMLADAFIDDKQVTVNVNTGQIALIKQFGWRYVIEHGIDVKNGKEEEYEDRIRALFDDPTYREATGLAGSSFDHIIIGNLHKGAFLERTIKNGALTGQNELGQAWRLKPIRAIQLMFGISKSHVRTWGYPVDLTYMRSEKALNAYSQMATAFVARHGRGKV